MWTLKDYLLSQFSQLYKQFISMDKCIRAFLQKLIDLMVSLMNPTTNKVYAENTCRGNAYRFTCSGILA